MDDRPSNPRWEGCHLRPGARRQRQRLEEEGVVFVNDKIDLKRYQWQGIGREDEPRQTTLF